MDREYKFRGQTINKEWVHGNLNIVTEEHKKLGQKVEPGYYISNRAACPFAFKIRPETVGQFIQLEDGFDFYEKDIVEEDTHGRKRYFVASDIRLFCKEFNNAEHSSKWKPISNIYDATPEQLKKWGLG